jgi:AcrR family transcriptional regulator
MGNREALLEGARQCLIEKGYVQTTARDIATASGVSLAAIGYHFGTKEALLQEAMVQANIEWGKRADEVLESTQAPEDADWASWAESVWEGLLHSSPEDLRLLQASFEVLTNVEKSTPVCTSINSSMFQARNALIAMFDHDEDELTDEQRDAIGRFYHALLVGIRSLQLVAPGVGPDAKDITTALQLIGRKMAAQPERTTS